MQARAARHLVVVSEGTKGGLKVRAATYGVTQMSPEVKDLRLPLLAAASLHIGTAEEAFEAGALRTAEHEIDKAEEALQELRDEWPEIEKSKQGLLAAFAAPLAERVSELRSRMPQTSIVTQGEAVEDPEQEIDPESELD